jgi:hypothetical protein
MRGTWLAGSVALLVGCAPQTQYRRTAYVPAVRPIAFDGLTAPAGTLRVEGSLTDTDVSTHFFPKPGDTAVLVPRWSMEGSALIAVNSHVEVGVRGTYADYGWSQANSVGTMPLPNSPASTGYGPELHLSFPLSDDHAIALGIAANLMLYNVPYAEWQLTGPNASPATAPCTPSASCVANYTLHDTRADSPLVYSVGLYPSYAIGKQGEYGHIVGVADATSGFSNDGFSDMPANGSTLSSVGPIIVLGLGYGYSHQWGRVSGLVYRPLTDGSSPVDYGWGFQLTFGVNIELWSRPAQGGQGGPDPAPPAPAPAAAPQPPIAP